MANGVETFLKYVLERSEEIGIHQENRGDSETFLSKLLVHVELLGKTVQFLHEISNISNLTQNVQQGLVSIFQEMFC